MHCEIVETAIGEAITVILEVAVTKMRERMDGTGLHPTFLTRAMRLTLARLEMLLWTALLPRRLDIWAINGVGTTSWFLLPVST